MAATNDVSTLDILLLGSGGREHALACKLAASPRCGKLYIAPGNGGTVAVFNLAPSQGDDKADFVFYGPCEETVPALLERARQMVAGAELLCCKCMSASLAICVI